MSTTGITDRAERSSATTRWRLDLAGSTAEFRVRTSGASLPSKVTSVVSTAGLKSITAAGAGSS